MVVNTDAFSDGPGITISQTVSGEVFEAGKAYSFKLDIGSSYIAPLSVLNPGADQSDPEKLEIIIGYGGGAGETITTVAQRTVLATELSIDFPGLDAPLTEDFTVTTDVLELSDAAVGQELRVMIRLLEGRQQRVVYF